MDSVWNCVALPNLFCFVSYFSHITVLLNSSAILYWKGPNPLLASMSCCFQYPLDMDDKAIQNTVIFSVVTSEVIY